MIGHHISEEESDIFAELGKHFSDEQARRDGIDLYGAKESSAWSGKDAEVTVRPDHPRNRFTTKGAHDER